MGWFSRNVSVTLIDDATGSVFATSEMPPADLPETFALETTLHIGDVDWSVMHAVPQTKAEFSKTRKLTLRLRRVEKVDLSKILYSLPSICDRIPSVGGGPLTADDLILAEDDWRQFELVSLEFADETDAEIGAIRHIQEYEKAEVGWRKLHVRRGPDPPISSALTLGDVDRAFGGGMTFRGVGFHGTDSRIVSGYSFRAPDGLSCYGTEEGGRVTVLGIVRDVSPTPPTRSAEALAEFARAFDLELVHWCRCAKASHESPLFRRLITGADHA
ncbi:MAG TPA: hypothetical protein VL371_00295 [Gemmataceae bacterium]|jgi:hypothetical protein|nr:hypothetical protein [Gemmataceae bacterium]